MSEELEEVRVLRVQPGDVIVFKMDMRLLSEREIDEHLARLKHQFPNNEVLVLAEDVELTVARPSS